MNEFYKINDFMIKAFKFNEMKKNSTSITNVQQSLILLITCNFNDMNNFP